MDNEANNGKINCMILLPLNSRKVMVYHGHNVQVDQFQIYRRLTSTEAKCYAWSTCFEKRYPNVTDLQGRYQVQSGATSLPSLEEATKAYGLFAYKCNKVDYRKYSEDVLTPSLIMYAAGDVITLQEMFNAHRPAFQFTRVITVGMFDYRVTNEEAS